MTPLQSATQAAESYLQSQRALEGLPASDILAERVIEAYEKAGGTAAEIERLTRERDEARELVIEANNSLYGSQGYFHSLNGGPFNKYHLASGIENLKQAANKNYRAIEAAEKSNAELREALEPFATIAATMFVDPENGWSDTDILSIEADPDFGSFAHLKAGDFRRARAALSKPEGDGK